MKIIILNIFLLLLILVPTKTFAQTSGNVGVTAVVDSKVSKIESTVDTNATETLADPSSHSILLTITLEDADGNPMPNISVIVSSSRGQVDVIEAISKISPYKAHAAEINDMQKDVTDKNGQVQFRVTSFIAGQAIFTVTADTLVALDPIKVTFDPLPFPTDVTVSMSNPFNGREITLYSPNKQISTALSAAQISAQKLVNTGTKIEISFWVVAIPCFVILLCPLFIFLNYLNLRKMRKMEKEQFLLLRKMFPPNYNRQS